MSMYEQIEVEVSHKRTIMEKMGRLERELEREGRFARKVQRLLARVDGRRDGELAELRACWRWIKGLVREKVQAGQL